MPLHTVQFLPFNTWCVRSTRQANISTSCVPQSLGTCLFEAHLRSISIQFSHRSAWFQLEHEIPKRLRWARIVRSAVEPRAVADSDCQTDSSKPLAATGSMGALGILRTHTQEV